ncbi:MAG: hypothetical protein LBB94_10135 [Clostridiales bacterium]|jgi:hypothetical protein|nr:hypothetical protein [Clostridiales bacterium]
MLYLKNKSELSAELFKNPSSEYRAAPFWAWNNKLDAKELRLQIDVFKKMGFGGFHMHVRTGMATPYLSDEYMDIIKTCVDKARAEEMLAWLYDEDRWPSGAAGGIVTKDMRYRARHLLLTRRPLTDGTPLSCFDVELDDAGCLKHYGRVGESDAAKGFKLYIYEEIAAEDPWYNNQTYVDTLNDKAIRRFIEVTHERYNACISKDFGGVVPAVFTDEPQFSRKGALDFAHEDTDVTLPWTSDLPETYADAYGNERLLEHLPELLWDLPGGAASVIRRHYHDHVCERFTKAFADQIGEWCAGHGLMLTGHMMEEPTLESQTQALGEAMRSYRSFQLPGIDILCDRREFTTAKQAQSAARQYGREGVLSELYGVTNWDFDFRGHKLQGDWQAALGVSVRVPHLSWVSMNGEAKRDYPGTFNYQAPWHKEYPIVEDHFARINTAMTRGKAATRLGVIHPIESYWLHWGARENTEAIRAAMDERFENLCDWLLRGLIDFDYICESTLPDQCDFDEITSGLLPVGQMRYDVVIVPALETIRAATLKRLEKFKERGGRLIFLGAAPNLSDAVVNERPQKLYARSEQLPFERIAVLNALENLRELEIRDSRGVRPDHYLYQMRWEDDARWLFIAHADACVNPDAPEPDKLRIRLRGSWGVTLYDTMTGGISPLEYRNENGWTVFNFTMYEHDSLLVRLEKNAAAALPVRAQNAVNLTCPARFTSPVPVTLHEPNVLLLDMAEYSLNGGDWSGCEEILRLDTALRKVVGWRIRGKVVAQPWVETDETTPHTVRLKYIIHSETDADGTRLALEDADKAVVTLNGEKASIPDGWYADKSVQTVGLPRIRSGENILIIEIPFGKKTNLEACYLLGDFGVEVRGTLCTLTPAVKRLAFGDITRQGLPFYGGNITYHLKAESKGGYIEVEATQYMGQTLRVLVDGKDRGAIVYSPYKLGVDGLEDGRRDIDLVFFGNRINTFGQLHCVTRTKGYWWGSNSWLTEGPNWSYEYQFWPQGVLKSPEVRTLK